MKISCQVVEDLLPLYHDEVCSEQTRVLVDSHLSECESCSNYFESISNKIFKENLNIDTEEAKINSLKSLKKQLFRKNILVAIFSIGVLIASYFLIFKLEFPIHYDENLFSIQTLNDDIVEFQFLKDDWYKCYHLESTIEVDGQPKNILMFYYSNTIWTKLSPEQQFISDSMNLFTSDQTSNTHGWTEGNWEKIRVDNTIDAVYYAVENYDDFFNNPSEISFENATLLWEK